jgi:LacI family transcriptional regulator
MTDAPAAPIAANVEKVAPMTTTPNATETKRVTIRDVAALAGVDASLVSRVLNDHPKASAGSATRQRIVEAASKLGYHPNVAARSLRTAKTWTLGLLLPNLTNPMYAAIARAAERRAQERGYGLVFGTHVEGEDEATFARMMQQRRVEGLLTASSVLGDAFLRRIAIGAIGPVVMLNRRVPGVRASVTVDDFAGAAVATNHLAELGHKKVAGIFGPGTIDTTSRRRAGFVKAGKQAGIDAILVDGTGLDPKSGMAAANQIFRDHPEVTGIFASTFAIATGVLRAARLSGLRIPNDISVVALHDSELADYFNPPLTTVRLPVEEMAGRAVDLLLDQIAGAAPRSVVVRTAPVLISRESTARPRKLKRLNSIKRTA